MSDLHITLADLPGAPLRLITPISAGRGWLHLVREALAALPPTVDVLQIKEKYGGLRIVTVPVTAELHYAVRLIEQRSLQVCEICGAEGHLWHDGDPGQPAGWLRTRCEKHINTRTSGSAPLLNQIGALEDLEDV